MTISISEAVDMKVPDRQKYGQNVFGYEPSLEDPSPTTTFKTTDHSPPSLHGIRATHCMPHVSHTLSVKMSVRDVGKYTLQT
jgi:hypothetical protein